jgi:hypothetical protein
MGKIAPDRVRQVTERGSMTSRDQKPRFDLTAVRRREIERHAKHIGAADTEDFWHWPIAWCWHNGHSTDPVGALIEAIARMGGTCSADEAEEFYEQAKAMRQRRKAPSLGKFLGLTFEQRRACRITTYGPRTPPALRQEANRMSHERRRRNRGARPREEYEANSLSRLKPWEAEGISRSTWERRRRRKTVTQVRPQPSLPFNGAKRDASPSAAPFFTVGDTLASFVCEALPQRGGRRGSKPLARHLHLSRQWLAARKACGLRHNRWRRKEMRQN